MATQEEILKKAEEYIPATFRMISGCRDEQTSADVSNVAQFKLPDPCGRAGGACTSALLDILYHDHHKLPNGEEPSFQEVLLKMRDELAGMGFTQVPQLSSSRPLDIRTPFALTSGDNQTVGTRRAVIIAINYVGQAGELSGCHNDANNVMDYIKDVHGFSDDNMTILMDDGKHTEPTRANILAAYRKVVQESVEGDIVFCHYSGHGGALVDDDGDEEDGFDETLVPVDYATAGQIRDDDLFKTLVAPMARGVTATCLMDCCHSGTVLDLPFVFVADGEQQEMTVPEGFKMDTLQGLFTSFKRVAAENPDMVNQLCGCKIL